MLSSSAPTLKRLAALVWCTGGVVLLVKSTGLFIEAGRSGIGPAGVVIAAIGGIGIGLLKGKYLFGRLCRRNLERIEALPRPMLWQFYRVRFFLFLGLMILLGVALARLAQGDPRILVPLAMLELSIATALLVSSRCFWKGKNH